MAAGEGLDNTSAHSQDGIKWTGLKKDMFSTKTNGTNTYEQRLRLC